MQRIFFKFDLFRIIDYDFVNLIMKNGPKDKRFTLPFLFCQIITFEIKIREKKFLIYKSLINLMATHLYLIIMTVLRIKQKKMKFTSRGYKLKTHTYTYAQIYILLFIQ